MRLKRLARLLEDLPIPDRAPDEIRREVVRSVNGYLLPRLERPDAPFLLAVAGPGGVGKSYLVNRLTGGEHCPEGAVRPTTTSPTLVMSSSLDRMTDENLERRVRAAAAAVRVVRDDGEAPGQMTLIDLPADERGVAIRRTVCLADLVLLVVTPERYADRTAWDLLGALASAGVPVWVVVNRTQGVGDEVVADFGSRLAAAGLPVPMFAVAEGAGDDLGGLRPSLTALEGRARDRLLEEGVTARIEAALRAAASLREPLEASHSAGVALAAAAGDEYERAAMAVHDLVAGHNLLSWAATSSWPVVVERLASTLTRRIGVTAGRTASAWTRIPGGRELLEGEGLGLWRHAPRAATEARVRLLRWEVEVAEIVEARARRRISSAKLREVRLAVMQRTLGDSGKVRWRVRRRLRGGVDPAADEARHTLATKAAAIVRDDQQRFLSRVGPRPSVGTIVELTQLTQLTRHNDEPREDVDAPDDGALVPAAEALNETGASERAEPSDA